jgi:hypothetical protein
MEGLFHVFTLATVGGDDAEVVGCCESWGRDVKRGCLGVGPDSCSFFTTYILHDFVLDVTENVVSLFVFGFTDLCADFDKESVFLLMSEWK